MIIRYPISTEKYIKALESENKMVFAVAPSATKPEIKKAIEEMLEAKVESINTLIKPDGEKRAIVRFSPDTPAIDIATKLGMM